MGTKMKADQERVKNLLTDTVTLLCKSGLAFDTELRVEGLLGVSIDNSDVFFVHISEKVGAGMDDDSPINEEEEEVQHQKRVDPPPKSSKRKRDKVSPSPSATPNSKVVHHPSVKIEVDEDDLFIVEKHEPASGNVNKSPVEQRVPPLHGTLGFNNDSLSQGYPPFETNSNEPPEKRRATQGAADSFVTGLVKNLHDQSGSAAAQNWINAGFPPDIAAQMAKDGVAGLIDGQPGCSTWPSPGGNTSLPSDAMSVELHPGTDVWMDPAKLSQLMVNGKTRSRLASRTLQAIYDRSQLSQLASYSNVPENIQRAVEGFAFTVRHPELPPPCEIDKRKIRKALQDRFADIKRKIGHKHGLPATPQKWDGGTPVKSDTGHFRFHEYSPATHGQQHGESSHSKKTSGNLPGHYIPPASPSYEIEPSSGDYQPRETPEADLNVPDSQESPRTHVQQTPDHLKFNDEQQFKKEQNKEEM